MYLGVIAGIIIVGAGFWWFGRAPAPAMQSTDTYGTSQTTTGTPDAIAPATTNSQTNQQSTNTMGNPHVTLKTSQGDIVLELFTDKMPITAGNFVKLAKEGYYTNTKFHRVIPNFMIQGGDPLTKDDSKMAQWGTGGPGYAIKDEFVAGLSNVRGTIAMANAGPGTGGSQFFINVVDNKALDFDVPDPNNSAHPVFGKVIAGMDVVDQISKSARNPRDVPTTPIVITAVEVQ